MRACTIIDALACQVGLRIQGMIGPGPRSWVILPDILRFKVQRMRCYRFDVTVETDAQPTPPPDSLIHRKCIAIRGIRGRVEHFFLKINSKSY